MSRFDPVTLDSLDDSLLDKRIKEINELKDENSQLRLKLSRQESVNEKKQEEINKWATRCNQLEYEKAELSEKLLLYEHDVIKMEVCDDGVDILYWDTETNKYELFASFSNNNLEEDLENFCREFVLELKDAYMVE